MIKENGIDFITAHNGGIQMYAGLGNLVGWGKTLNILRMSVRQKVSRILQLKRAAAWTLQTKKGLTTTMVQRFFEAEAMDMLTVMECD